ncbi:hypothetical protein Micbo1qcDRAFT_201526 [Microdochium bolleyi]|uniref:BTB domain-containing protein n=1 Tax=Microdochium bolleyi TaxID=196109 RepID=A0A136JGC5_9PEZI|nr:hypothetical protein Micbo1qcDRAFT_201526 [Microdochium bolleyi]
MIWTFGTTPGSQPWLPARTIVESRGDLLLKVGYSPSLYPEGMTYRVCSRAVARSSPVFTTMLFGGFSESKPSRPDQDWVVDLPDDNPTHMAQLLHLMHGNWSDFTMGSSFGPNSKVDSLYHFLVLTDKYDCTKLVQPWVKSWLCSLSAIIMRNHRVLYMLSWIYFQLGDRLGYEEVVTSIASGSGRSAVKPLLPALPPNLEANITSTRTACLNSVLNPVRLILQDLAGDDESKKRKYCRYQEADSHNPNNDNDTWECPDRILGALIRGLTSAKLWPLRETSQIMESPYSIQETLNKINASSKDHDHGGCLGCKKPRNSPRGASSEAPFKACPLLLFGKHAYTASGKEATLLAEQAKKAGLA